MNGEEQAAGQKAPPQQGGKAEEVGASMDYSQNPGQRPFQSQEQTELATLHAQGLGGRLFVC